MAVQRGDRQHAECEVALFLSYGAKNMNDLNAARYVQLPHNTFKYFFAQSEMMRSFSWTVILERTGLLVK
jgi:hypothetical protein